MFSKQSGKAKMSSGKKYKLIVRYNNGLYLNGENGWTALVLSIDWIHFVIIKK